MKTDLHFGSYLPQFFVEWRLFQTRLVEKITTQIVFNTHTHTHTHTYIYIYVSNIVPLMKWCGKLFYSRADHTWKYGAWALHLGYEHTFRICNTYWFYTLTVVGRMRLDVTYVICTLPVLWIFMLSCCYCTIWNNNFNIAYGTHCL